MQKDFENRSLLPCRVSCIISGLETQIFNNSEKFENLFDLKTKREQSLPEVRVKEKDLPPANRKKVPWYYVVMPATRFVVQQGAIFICPLSSRFHTAMTFRKANLTLVVTTTVNSPQDDYRWSIGGELRWVEVTLIPNKAAPVLSGKYPFVELSGTVRTEEAIAEIAGKKDHEEVATSDTDKFMHGKCFDEAKGEFTCNSPERHIMKSPVFKILYVQDEGGFMMKSGDYDPDHSPEFSVDVEATDCVINYGAWANFERALQQYRFFPEEWKSFDEKVFHAVKGEKRVAGWFKMKVKLILDKLTHTSFRVPFRRELYPSEKLQGNQSSHVLDWMEFQCDGKIKINYKLPWVTLPGS